MKCACVYGKSGVKLGTCFNCFKNQINESRYKFGWAEVDKMGNIVVGKIGFKVYKRRLDILKEGFSKDEIARVKVVVKIL